jgi:hypothetical protein
VYQFDQLLHRQVPWWIASKNYISFVDVGAARWPASSTRQNIPAISRTRPASTRPASVYLRAVSYRSGLGLTLPVLTGLITLLAAALLYSIWRIRRHMRERSRAEQACRPKPCVRRLKTA